jgi:hypothetical protein
LLSLAAAILLTAFAPCGFLVVRKLTAGNSRLPLNTGWIDDLSPGRYGPMLRLLDRADVDFLCSQPGVTARMAGHFRARRCLIFQSYLRWLNSDFGRICTALKVLMVQSRKNRPGLAGALVHHQLLFAGALLGVQCRLFLYRWGLCSVDASALVMIFDAMRQELRDLAPERGAV